jgi:hypothetical protein
MSEITKLYENAGIKKHWNSTPYGGVEEHYPPFTAEKQIELIKWLTKNTYRNYLMIRYNFTNYFWQIECNMTDSDRVDNFSEALASVCNSLWQDLTEEEKQQVKNIL